MYSVVPWKDIATAVAAKEALEGHCIYEGGYCKLHISYSRHTDLNVKVTIFILISNTFTTMVINNLTSYLSLNGIGVKIGKT